MSLNRQKCSFFPEKKKKKEEKVMRHMFIHLTGGARERERESTMMEEKRGLMGRKTSLTKGIVFESSMGTSVSKTPRTETFRAELLKYCEEGLTGSKASSSFSKTISFSFCFSVTRDGEPE
jgi:hypothetical protein